MPHTHQRVLSTLALCSTVGLLTAQAPDTAAKKVTAMKKLEFMVGEWEGDGWTQHGPGPRQRFRGKEIVKMKLGGVALLIEGIHRQPKASEKVPALVHHALAIISVADDGGYRFRSWLATGRTGNFHARVESGAMIWGYKHPRAGEMRYTIRLDDKGRWHEIGEMSRKKGEWVQFFEMTLTKKKSPAKK